MFMMIDHGESHKENLIPGRKYRSFKKNSDGKYVRGWVNSQGIFTPTKPHHWSWRAIPNMLAKLPMYEGYPILYWPIRAILKISAQRLWELIPSEEKDVYDRTILDLVREDSELQSAWKEMTMAIIEKAMELIPFPEAPEGLEGVEDILKEWLLLFADDFYNLMFSIQL
jgi:hypothetical protein